MVTERISSVDVLDVRFPTSRHRDGSDAMNPFPDYSAAYVVLHTSAGATGHGLVFTVGRGTEIQVAAVRSLAAMVIGRPVDALVADPGALARQLIGDSQIRWLGPEKGVVHMAAGGLVNAVWDLAARRAGRPLWQLLASLSPEALVAQVDFRYLRDALTEDEALQLLQAAAPGRAERQRRLLEDGYPAYTTTPGWLGYDDQKLERLCAEAVDAGYRLIKLKVGGNLADDVRRMGIARQAVGPAIGIAVDANQIWGVPDAIRWMRELSRFDPYWIEEPTSPDDVLGHAAVRRALAPMKVATGEHVHNAVMFKQLLQAGAVDVVQIDACRVGGVNENLAILLLAAKFGVPVCPHAGGVGLCELVQHLALFDFTAVSATMENRFIEYVDHLHEHFTDPVRIRGGRYVAPTAPGMSAQIVPASLAAYRFPDGPAWAIEEAA
ncbi:enolase C-terminal domain-like protein [Dactylosporangium matsuzakiense]|uniref:enolase C-terminal domain-like protein n=1 Tax=Dactylosporangium matsuzakiense TaxID=53360 RepID=UPI0021C31D9D|nr:enolase C-terminal domain-like protein [Dactylosporangium matsuzakiense]UWZ49647.1 fuconate dehydratase [Dactylosporangium matsuzakiense]